MIKVILNGKEARDKIASGINKVCDTVKVTLGAMGKNVLIKHSYISTQGHGVQHFPTQCTKDGVKVIRSLTLSDSVENVGADLVKEASEKTMSMAGDGTTTTAVLLQAIVNKGLELIDAGVNGQELKKGIDKGVEYVVDELKKMAVPIDNDNEKIKHIATVSANNDEAIGQLIADAFAKIGKDGNIDIEEAKDSTTEIKITDGFKFNKGWVSPYFINKPSKQECELINPYILLYDKKISNFAQIEKVINLTASQNKPLFIICDDIDGEALAFLSANTAAGKIKVCAVKSPEFGEMKRESMEDIAVVTGGTYISDEKGAGLKDIQLTTLGKAKKVIISKEETIIIEGGKNKKIFTDLLNDLKMNLTQAKGGEKEKIERRISKLTGSIAVLYVGAATEVEMREKIDRCDDAVRATKSAIAEGYVAGGGTAFLRIEYKAESKGEDLLMGILLEPLNQICINAGVPSKVVDVLQETGNIGYNAKTDKIEDLVAAGIIDPVKVLRTSLQNAASAAGAILTSEALIVDTL
jgi:chaperonin GroEL